MEASYRIHLVRSITYKFLFIHEQNNIPDISQVSLLSMMLVCCKELSCGEQGTVSGHGSAILTLPCRNTVLIGTATPGSQPGSTTLPTLSPDLTCNSDTAQKAHVSTALCRRADNTFRLMTLWHNLLWIALHLPEILALFVYLPPLAASASTAGKCSCEVGHELLFSTWTEQSIQITTHPKTFFLEKLPRELCYCHFPRPAGQFFPLLAHFGFNLWFSTIGLLSQALFLAEGPRAIWQLHMPKAVKLSLTFSHFLRSISII